MSAGGEYVMRSIAITTLIVLAALGVVSAAEAKALTDRGGRTGICARKLDWFDNQRQLQHHLETVIYERSAHTDADVRREDIYRRDVLNRYLPEMRPDIWVGAWVTDDNVDQAHGPDCLKLPTAHEK
jgi:hypothetical protein